MRLLKAVVVGCCEVTLLRDRFLWVFLGGEVLVELALIMLSNTSGRHGIACELPHMRTCASFLMGN